MGEKWTPGSHYKMNVRLNTEIKVGCALTDERFESVYQETLEELQTMIEKKGDNGGMRKQPWYLVLMILEKLKKGLEKDGTDTVGA